MIRRRAESFFQLRKRTGAEERREEKAWRWKRSAVEKEEEEEREREQVEDDDCVKTAHEDNTLGDTLGPLVVNRWLHPFTAAHWRTPFPRSYPFVH